jgi:hypothetical protein
MIIFFVFFVDIAISYVFGQSLKREFNLIIAVKEDGDLKLEVMNQL